MADDSPAVIGIEKCGCVTYANSRPDLMDRHDVKALNDLRKRGGRSQMVTVAEARAMPNFMPSECPHPTPPERKGHHPAPSPPQDREAG